MPSRLVLEATEHNANEHDSSCKLPSEGKVKEPSPSLGGTPSSSPVKDPILHSMEQQNTNDGKSFTARELDESDAPGHSCSSMTNEQKVLRIASNRLTTFSSNGWPKESQVNIGRLAEAGFFLRRERSKPDEAECVYCHLKISNWTPSLDPFLEHQNRNPRCDFLMGYNVGNIPLDGNVTSDPIRGKNPVLNREPDLCGSSPTPSTSGETSPSIYPPFLGPVAHAEHRPPAHPHRITFESRLRTFPTNWKDICPLDATALAEAGFFYEGTLRSVDGIKVHDAVKCFHCDRRIYDWQADDDPWIEHKKFRSDCYFLRLNYDRTRDRPSPSESPSSSVPSSSPSSSTSPSPSGTLNLSSLAKELSSVSTRFEEQQKASSSSASGDARCKICLEGEVEILFLPCRHASCCSNCATAVSKCPYCRAEINGSVRIFLS